MVPQKRTRLQALHWRAIRSASTQHLRFFSQIGAGDLEKLEQLIDEDARRREEAAEAEEANGTPVQQTTGYDSDSSVLEMTPKSKLPEPEPEKDEAEAAPKQEEENKSGEEAGTPPPPPTAATGEKNTEPVVVEDDDEPGTPPPKAVVASPGTPKRPREEEEEDAAMTEGETAAKRLKVE